jgi:hypothetical protein
MNSSPRMKTAYAKHRGECAYTWEQCGTTPEVRCKVVVQKRRCVYAYRWHQPFHLKDGLPPGVPASVMVEMFPDMLGMLYGTECDWSNAASGWKAFRKEPRFAWLMRKLLFAICKYRMLDLPPWKIIFQRGFIRSSWCVWDLLLGKRMMCPALLYKAWPMLKMLEEGQIVDVECPDEQTRVVMRFTKLT